MARCVVIPRFGHRVPSSVFGLQVIVAANENVVGGVGGIQPHPFAGLDKQGIGVDVASLDVVIKEAARFIEPQAIVAVVCCSVDALAEVVGNDVVFDGTGTKVDAVAEVFDDGIVDNGG